MCRLSELEDKIENGTLKEIPKNAVVLTQEEWATVHEQFAQAMYQKEVHTRKETVEKFAEMADEELRKLKLAMDDTNHKFFCKADCIKDIYKLCKKIKDDNV